MTPKRDYRECTISALSNLDRLAQLCHGASARFDAGMDWVPTARRALAFARVLEADLNEISPEPTDGPQPSTSQAPSTPIRETTSAPAER